MNKHIVLVIIGMFAVTFIPRILPTLLFSKYEMPKWLRRVIKYVPISVFSYLIMTDVLFVDQKMTIGFANTKFLPALATLIVAIKSKSIGITILVGVLGYILYQYGMTMPPLL